MPKQINVEIIVPKKQVLLVLLVIQIQMKKKVKKEKMKMTNSEKEQKREKDSDRGLAWGSSWFKNGILKLKKGDVKKNKVNVDTKVRLSGMNRDAKGKGGKKSKKGAKGSKKRGAGKKSSRR